VSKYEIELEYDIQDCRDCPFVTERKYFDNPVMQEYQMSAVVGIERIERHCGINQQKLEYAIRPTDINCPLK